MGCPQGSVLGPTLWNVLLDDLLRMPVPDGVTFVAYADDVTVLIESESRAGLERSAAAVLSGCLSWGERNRLGFSSEKSCSITLKGSLGKRPPTVRLGNRSVRAVTSTRLLGVTIDEKLSFAEHAQDAVQRAAKCFGKMARVSASSWGVKYRALSVIYRGTFVPTVTYAAAIWHHRVGMYVVRRRLVSGQRTALVLLTKAYRTTSSDALAVLAGVLPADLEVSRAGRLEEHRVNSPNRGEEWAQLRAQEMERAETLWQERWLSSEKGKDLKRFFPDVRERRRATWVEPDHCTSQMLTGHGCFRGRLRDLGLAESGMCSCGSTEEYRDHVLWECRLYDEERGVLLSGIVRVEEGPVYFADLVSSQANFLCLLRFASAWHKKRSLEEWHDRSEIRRAGQEVARDGEEEGQDSAEETSQDGIRECTSQEGTDE